MTSNYSRSVITQRRRISIAGLLAILVASLAFFVAAPTPAHAAGAPITRMNIEVNVAIDGTATVTQTFDMDFGSTPGHGPYLFFVTRQAIQDDPDHWRVYQYKVTSVTSPTGAPTDTKTTRTDDGINIRIGDPDIEVTGVQTYVATYTVQGLVNPNVASSGYDELFWNVLGTGFEVPISNITVTVTGPAALSEVTCYTGPKYGSPCTSNQFNQGTGTFTQQSLPAGSGLAVVLGWPAGTFQGAKPILVTREPEPTPADLVDTGALAAGGGVAAVTAAIFWLVGRRKSRNQIYAGLTPGLTPAPGQQAEVTTVGKVDAAVQFTPPRGVPAGLVGTLIDSSADTVDVSATIVDLAVRGHLQIAPANGGGKKDFELVRRNGSGTMWPFESQLYRDLFMTGSVVHRRDLEQTFGEDVAAAKTQMWAQVVQLGWYRQSATASRTGWTVLGFVAGFIFLGLFFNGLSTFNPYLLAASVPALVATVGALAVGRIPPGRTAAGTAVYAQALGFKKYLETAEVDQIRWEEGEDIFSRYLPFAIAFGCADRWAKVFADAAARGINVPVPTWYIGVWPHGYGVAPMFTQISSSIDSITSASMTAQTAATAASSGGSGFSSGGFGGGGFGGGGGGGGGSW